MRIPSDPESRFWLELAGANPERAAEFGQSLVAFVAFDKDRTPGIAGTGFVIASGDGMAVVLTARHVLDFAHDIQRPRAQHAPSALAEFLPQRAKDPSLHPTGLKAMWMGADHADMLNVAHVCFNDTTDLACGIVTAQAGQEAAFLPVSIPIDTVMPEVGSVVHMVSQDGFEVTEAQPPSDDATGHGQTLTLGRRVSIRIGTVTGVYPEGHRQYRWPCFTTSMPAEPGMSGGLVFVPRDEATIAACGIVCADVSPDAARTDNNQCGESIIGCTWAALGLRLPNEIPAPTDAPSRTILQMMRDGDLLPSPNGIEHIECIELGQGDCQLVYRGAPDRAPTG